MEKYSYFFFPHRLRWEGGVLYSSKLRNCWEGGGVDPDLFADGYIFQEKGGQLLGVVGGYVLGWYSVPAGSYGRLVLSSTGIKIRDLE